MLASNFLIPNGTFIVVLIAFLIVVGFIGRYVVPYLNKLLTERQEQIRGELEAADRAKADAEEADRERRATLDAARQQARDIVAQASTTADQITSAAESRAQRSTTASWRRPTPRCRWPARRRSTRCPTGSARSCWLPLSG